MYNQLLERINFDFDIKNHKELSPYMFFTDVPLYSALQSKLTGFNVRDYHHASVLFTRFETIEQNINNVISKMNDKEKMDEIFNRFIRNLRYILDLDHTDSSIENLFSIQPEITQNLLSDSQYFMRKYKKIIKRNLMQMPISTALFPHYRQITSNYFFYDDHTFEDNANNNNLVNNEQKLTEIIDNSIGDNKNPQSTISFDDLIQFLDILSPQTKVFSFSPSFILNTIEKFNTFLNTLFFQSNSNQQNNDNFDNNYLILNGIRKLQPGEEKQTKITYFRLIMLIKMRLYLIIQKVHEALSILLLFIIMEQENCYGFDVEKKFSFKKMFQEILPLTKKRSKIIQNLSSDQIIDFYNSSDEKNDFILAKNGLFKVNQENELSKISIDLKILENLDQNNAKIAFSDNILYILTLKDRTIHTVLIEKEAKDDKKDENSKKHSYTKNKDQNEKAKSKHKRINKKLREKARREKKMQRKMERKENEKYEIDLNSVLIDLPDYPIVSMGVYNNYVRILQKKSYENRKTNFILTNVDLTPNSRVDFDVLNAFENVNDVNKTEQSQTEIIIDDKSDQYKLFDACFSKDFLYFSFEDSSFEQWIVFKDGTAMINKHSLSPYLLSSNLRIRIDNESFLHVMEPVQDNSICFIKMDLTKTKYYIRTDSKLLTKYSYLQNLSDIVDNCAHLIINKELIKGITTEEYNEAKDFKKEENKKAQINNQNSFTVTPEEMSTVVQSPTAITLKMNELKDLVNEIKDNELKQFFISLFIKMSGINLLYCTRSYYSSKNTINDIAKERFQKFRTFILDLFSFGKSYNSISFEIMMKESILFAFSLAAKYLFLDDQYETLHNFINDSIISSECSNILLRNLSYFIFAYPSSLYIVDNSILDSLMKFGNDINIHEMLMKNLNFIPLEIKFSTSMKDDFIKNLSPYVQSAFKYTHNLILNESEPLIKVVQIFSYFMSFDANYNPFYSITLLEEISKLITPLYNRIKCIKEVIESDTNYKEQNKDLFPQTVHKETKILESLHPYNLNSSNIEKEDDKKIIEDLGVIDFGPQFDAIYAMFDNKCNIPKDDKIMIYCKNEETSFSRPKDFLFNQAIKFKGNNLRVKLLRTKDSDNNESHWGFKITFIGVSFNQQFYWIPNKYLHFYNAFMMFYCMTFGDALDSTSITKNEKEFNLILDEKIIQGIKFEEIDIYEKQLDQNTNPQSKKPKRTLTRGISRGISFDTDNDAAFSDEFKKSFLKDFINAKEDHVTRGKKLLDILYLKTAKKNRIRLNDATKSILENERYLAACLFKQLGLINVCLKFIDNVITKNINPDEIELPSRLQSVWKKIYSLRQTLFFSYQKSKLTPNKTRNKDKDSIKLNFKQYSEEIKRKCILLLYSDPILKFKEKGNLDNDTIESASSTIFSFVTSEISLSNISDLIDIRRKRLSLKIQSLKLLSTLLDQDFLFESSKSILVKNLARFSSYYQNKLNGLTKNELDEYHKLFDKITLKYVEKFYNNPSIDMITKLNSLFIFLFCFDGSENYFQLEISKVLINVLENNKDKKFFIHDLTNLNIISALICFAIKYRNNQIIDYVFSLLFSDDIDLISKKQILVFMPLIISFIPDNAKILDKKLAYSFIEKHKNSPIIISASFYWIASILNSDKIITDEDDAFVSKVLKSIGQSFVGENCSFIDDSFSSFTSRQIAEGMISFIRFLFNMKNEIFLKSAHDILLNKINKINFVEEDNIDDVMKSIGLFSSIAEELSAFEPERCIFTDSYEINYIVGFNPSLKKIRKSDNYDKKFKGIFTNAIMINPKQFDLNDKEIENIFQLHEAICKSKYFQTEPKYDVNISQKEINENVLISSFYSFLPVIIQNKNNASILMNEKNISKTLSLFNFAANSIPTNENSIFLLSHYREKAILSTLYSSEPTKNENVIDKNGSFRFMKMNYGEIIHNNDGNYDVIKSRKDHYNLFFATRPFSSDKQTYFEVKINKIGNRQIFIGFIDSEEVNLNKAFGFGCQGQSKVFCRRSSNLSKSIEISNDKIMKKDNEFSINDGDRIGCYYTNNYIYLTLNGVLTKYRLSHSSCCTYIPLISIDHDEISLEITHNVSFVDNEHKFDFLNIQPDDFFKEKDLTEVIAKSKYSYDSDNLVEDHICIGQYVYFERTIFLENESKMETIDVISNDLLRERENFGIIKDINPINQNPFVNKLNLESYNHLTMSKEIINDVDSRYLAFKKTNFFNIIENRTNTKFGMNNEFNLNELSKELRDGSDFNLISSYLRKKTIFENSKSISIILTRYLIFILIDYLRYIKSPLLQDEGIESKEMNCILNSLSVSIPTITDFKPKFVLNIEKDEINDYIIFKDENEDEVKKKKFTRRIASNKYLFPPGFNILFSRSFKVFIKKSEQFVSAKFITKLLQMSIEKTISKDILTCDYLYSLIPPKYKIESICPLPIKFEKEKDIQRRKLRKVEKISGFIPILLNTIPSQLPEVECYNKKYRDSSNQVTYFNHFNDSIDMKWEYDMNESKIDFDPNYKLKFGLLFLKSNLPENLLNSSLGFIQTLLNIFQGLSDSDNYFDKLKEFLRGYLLEKIFSLSTKKCPLAHPFIQIIIVMLISKFGFSDNLFDKNDVDASFLFNSLSNKLHQMKDFPTGKNELPLLFSIYSNLIQMKINEIKNDNVSDLFNNYYEINEILFKIGDDDEPNKNKNQNNLEINEKKKNFRSLYLLYYYSSLLHNDEKLPYPTFLFVHDWLRQKFGGFRKTISKIDINYFKAIKIDENKEIIYKSDILNNQNDLSCSCQLFNIYEKKDEEEEMKEKDKDKKSEKVDIKPANKVFIHQLKDDKQIEIPQSVESVMISFPLEIIIIHEKDGENKLKELERGDVFIFNFLPSEKMQKDCFIENYNQIQKDIKQFISLEKYDNEIMESFNAENSTNSDNNNNNNENNNINENNSNDNENNNIDNENNDNNENNNIDNENNDNNENNNIDNENNENEKEVKSKNKKDFAVYKLHKIPTKSDISIQNLPSSINPNVVALRCSTISTYRFLIESIMVSYTIDQDDDDDDDDENGYSFWWRKNRYSDEKAPNRYMQQIIGPAYSMCTESKFMFINKILKSETKEEYELKLIFNRFEQQKYFEKKDNETSSVRPLFVQMMEQIDENSINLLKVRGAPPFKVNLVGEGALDGGGPGREIFSSLIVEMMNDKLGIFTSNPNRLRQYKETNREDLIPNKKLDSEKYSDDMIQILTKRFLYAGALIAVCIVSTLPQPMKLANFIWEYLTNETVSIESIFEIDEDFKQLILKAEFLENKLNSSNLKMNDDEFRKNFFHVFEIRDSYNNVVELVPSGSNIPVTKENLHEFIQLAKKERIHEFDKELKELKEGFDKIMIFKNITSILRPNELKLLVCGEMECKVEQMRKIMEIHPPSLRNEKISEDEIINMFWNVMESFSIDERTLFIRFSSGNLGLPAPGLKWEENIKVYISSREEKEKEGKTMVTSSTCSSEATIPFYESEDELAKMIRISLKFFGMITDGSDELEEISFDLF